MAQPDPARHRSRRIVWPLLALTVLAGAWTAFWFHAAALAEAEIAAWRAREAEAGRIHACGTQEIAGYPFRLELRCTDPAFELRSMQPTLMVRAKNLVAVVQVYDPRLVIAEITGPLTIAEASQS